MAIRAWTLAMRVEPRNRERCDTPHVMKTSTNLFAAAVVAVLAGTVFHTQAGTTAESKAPVQVETGDDIWVHPITGPYWNEDSFLGNDVRVVVAHHSFPGAIFGGGTADVYAAQLRLNLAPKLQLVAYKDGYMEIDTVGYKNDGWNDIAAGLKYAFLHDDANKLYSAVGVGYEFASGDDNVLQDDDEIRVWWSINKGFGRFHVGATVNYFIATDNGNDAFGDSDHLSWHIHADYQLNKWISPVIEVNGYHVTDEGSPVTPFSGADVLNLGGNSSESLITGAVGIELRPTERISVRAAYERAITDDTSLFGHRWTFSTVFEF
jgi:predicted porin